MSGCEHHEAQEKHRSIEQQGFLPTDCVTHESGKYCGDEVTQHPTTRYYNTIIKLSLKPSFLILTNPASLLLCDVEVIEDGEGSKDDIVGGGAVLAPVTMVILKANFVREGGNDVFFSRNSSMPGCAQCCSPARGG